jgi:ABC-type transport system involved in multi-copper enzyme maturation permease subunit
VRLVSAELLKLRRRTATYVVLGVLLVIMALIYLLAGLAGAGVGAGVGGFILRFPAAYGIISLFVFGLGSLLAVVYAAAIAGADWNWGVLRNVIARGESRLLYVLSKAAALAVVLALGVLVAFGAGILLTYMAAAMIGVSVSLPLSVNGLRDLASELGLGYLVLLQRAAIGFAVAVMLRSQLAGIVVGIALYIGESILVAILSALSFGTRFIEGDGFGVVGPEWYQFLPFGIGDNVLRATPGSGLGGDIAEALLRPVPLNLALVTVVLYAAGAIVISLAAAQREEIKA